ncbi:hypothetical protein, partial [Micromonospora sp. DT62]|uniref:hypothetical protein n=1 Tax=Micromonospora sp. DT62 TaxID=3416521 RepID=UPI003CEDD9CD
MSRARSRSELLEQSTIVRGRPASAAPVVTQLVAQPEGQTLKRNLKPLGPVSKSVPGLELLSEDLRVSVFE